MYVGRIVNVYILGTTNTSSARNLSNVKLLCFTLPKGNMEGV